MSDVAWRGIDLVIGLGSIVAPWLGFNPDFSPSTIRGRVARCRRGGYEDRPGAWRELGQALVPVGVVLDGKDLSIQSETGTLSLAAFVLIGVLDYPARPRATDPTTGVELESGVVLRANDRVAELLLLRKEKVAVLALVAGWPSPTQLSHGLSAAEIIDATQ